MMDSMRRTPELSNRVLIRGWLKKKGSFISGWKTYYFVLHGTTLSVFNSSDYLRSQPKRQHKIVFAERSLEVTNGCIVSTTHGKPLHLACHTVESLHEWLTALRLVTKNSTVVSNDVRSMEYATSTSSSSISHDYLIHPPTQHTLSQSQSHEPSSISSNASSIGRDDHTHEMIESLLHSQYYIKDQNILSDEQIEKQKEKIYLFVPTTGTSVAIPQDVIRDANLLVYRMAEKYNYCIPDRGDLDDPTITWLNGKPNYALANLAYFRGKTQNHSKDSFELKVENLVKTWEMEASHKPNMKQWKTINTELYHVQANNGRIVSGLESARLGNYNWLMEDVDKELYDSSHHTHESSHMTFRNAFPKGFPWELVEIFSGPPKVAFSWRHWAEFTGIYKENKGHGEMLEMFGFGIITLDESLKVCKLEIYYKPEPFLEALEGKISVNDLQRYSSTNTDRYSDISKEMDEMSMMKECPITHQHQYEKKKPTCPMTGQVGKNHSLKTIRINNITNAA